MKIYEFEDGLFCLSVFVVASNIDDAREICDEEHKGCIFVKEHKIEYGLTLIGGGNG